MEKTKQDKIDEFVSKTLAAKKQDRMDLSSDEDLSIAIMNLISLEEHFFFSGAKTKKPVYYELLGQIREIRKQMLKRIIKEYEGEVWCISKHLLAASMRLMEYGTKMQSMGKKDDSLEMFERSYELYSLFWGLNLDLIDTDTAKKFTETTNALHSTIEKGREAEMGEEDGKEVEKENGAKQASVTKNGFLSKLGDMVKKAVDCCIE
jgi:hypothetical protein